MRRRQTIPRQWLITNRDLDRQFWIVVRRLPRGSGILLLECPCATTLRRLRLLAALSDFLIVADVPGKVARVHNARELRQALLRRTPVVLLSPLFKTLSHPDWRPLPRMRAASLAKLGKRRLIALGGMTEERYGKLAQLGFIGWAGISAWRQGRSCKRNGIRSVQRAAPVVRPQSAI